MWSAATAAPDPETHARGPCANVERFLAAVVGGAPLVVCSGTLRPCSASFRTRSDRTSTSTRYGELPTDLEIDRAPS